jgi:Ion channel
MVTSMLFTLSTAGCLMALCVVVHAVGLTTAFGWMKRRRAGAMWDFWPAVRLLIVLAYWIIFLHLVEIAFWAFLYTWTESMPDLPSAFYFSAVTYTTTGYGDLVLPKDWRLVGGIEALTGILMCGWSTGFFFAVVSRMYAASQLTRPASGEIPENQARRSP